MAQIPKRVQFSATVGDLRYDFEAVSTGKVWRVFELSSGLLVGRPPRKCKPHVFVRAMSSPMAAEAFHIKIRRARNPSHDPPSLCC